MLALQNVDSMQIVILNSSIIIKMLSWQFFFYIPWHHTLLEHLDVSKGHTICNTIQCALTKMKYNLIDKGSHKQYGPYPHSISPTHNQSFSRWVHFWPLFHPPPLPSHPQSSSLSGVIKHEVYGIFYNRFFQSWTIHFILLLFYFNNIFIKSTGNFDIFKKYN